MYKKKQNVFFYYFLLLKDNKHIKVTKKIYLLHFKLFTGHCLLDNVPETFVRESRVIFYAKNTAMRYVLQKKNTMRINRRGMARESARILNTNVN